MLLPQLVLYGNFDPAAVGTALQAEFSANSRYQSLSAQEKTQAQSDFVAGSAKLLIAVGSLIGRGAVDQSPPSAGLAGYRKIDVSFCENDGTLLDPTLYFDLWGLISGPLVQGHPLLAMLARPVTPSYAAVEGGSWIRITGTGLVAGTTITIGSSAASTIEAMSNGKTLYCVVPPGIEGGADVAVTVPGQEPTIYAGALTYVTDVVTVARALAVSLAVRLTAIRDRGSELSAANTLGDTAKTQLRLDAEEAVRGVEAIMSLRGDAGGGSLASPEIGDAWLAAASTIQPVYDEVDSMATQ
jgi:hypothetical protein